MAGPSIFPSLKYVPATHLAGQAVRDSPSTLLPPPPPSIVMAPPVSRQCENAFQRLNEKQKKNASYQYEGIPGFARWMASSNDFSLLRRYSQGAARCLLYLQHEIGKREDALSSWDDYAMKQPYKTSQSSSFEDENYPERTKLIKELMELLSQYYDLANSFAQVKSRPPAAQHQLRNLKNWFVSNPEAILPSEQYFRNKWGEVHEDDLFAIVTRQDTPLRRLMLQSRRMRLLFTRSRHSLDRVESQGTKYYSNTLFDNTVCLAIVLPGLALLFGPMWWLHYVDDAGHMLGIITGFVTLFTFWLWVAAGPRQFEILLGTAAYAAVLYIYVQTATSGRGSKGGND